MRRSFSGKSEKNIGIFAFRISTELDFDLSSPWEGLLYRRQVFWSFPSERACRPQTPLCKTSPNNVGFPFYFFCDKVLLTSFLSDLKKEKRKRVDLEVNVSFQRKALVLGAVVTTCWVSALQSLVGKDIGTLRVFEQLIFSCFFFLKQSFLLHFINIHYRH